MNPIEIRVVSNAEWWQPWLPVLASVVIAAAAPTVMWRTLKSNRSIEVDKWRRDVLSRSLVKATEISTWCEEEFNARRVWDDSSERALLEEGRRIESRTTELAAVITQLHLIRAHDAAYATRSLRSAIHDALGTVISYRGPEEAAGSAAFQSTLSFIREKQGMMIVAGQRELEGRALSGDDAKEYYEEKATLGDSLKATEVA